MNILMMTNTYTPIVGGLEKSVMSFSDEYRKHGHQVLIVTPVFSHMPEHEEHVVRIPAIQNFNGTDFSVQLPIPGILSEALKDFKPDIVHSHHPFLIGDTALRVASQHKVPVIFTHHTLFEQYTHYVLDSSGMKKFVIELSTGYANLVDHVFAPSESVAHLLKERGVQTPMDIVPTGVYVKNFAKGNGKMFRQSAGIPEDAFLVGHVGRLAPEKNLSFLSEAIARFLKKDKAAHFLAVGKGPSEEPMKNFFQKEGLRGRLHFLGVLQGQALVDAYHAMDVFAFASKSETQGMVLTEAMAASVPVVALDAPGVREVVKDGVNGRLLGSENVEEFANALRWFDRLAPEERKNFDRELLVTAEKFSMERCSERALRLYKFAQAKGYTYRHSEESVWNNAMRRIKVEWELLKNFTKAATTAMEGTVLDKLEQ